MAEVRIVDLKTVVYQLKPLLIHMSLLLVFAVSPLVNEGPHTSNYIDKNMTCVTNWNYTHNTAFSPCEQHGESAAANKMFLCAQRQADLVLIEKDLELLQPTEKSSGFTETER